MHSKDARPASFQIQKCQLGDKGTDLKKRLLLHCFMSTQESVRGKPCSEQNGVLGVEFLPLQDHLDFLQSQIQHQFPFQRWVSRPRTAPMTSRRPPHSIFGIKIRFETIITLFLEKVHGINFRPSLKMLPEYRGRTG